MLWTLISIAFGASFTTADTPASMTFEYTYTSPISLTSSTVFTFEDDTTDNSTGLCSASQLCMSGDFVTADSGNGYFATSALRENCTSSNPPASPGPIEIVPRTCDVIQTLELTYVYRNSATGPEYSGEAFAGSVTEYELYYCPGGTCVSQGFFSQNFSSNPMDFVGDIGGMGGFIVGTFVEI